MSKPDSPKKPFPKLPTAKLVDAAHKAAVGAGMIPLLAFAPLVQEGIVADGDRFWLWVMGGLRAPAYSDVDDTNVYVSRALEPGEERPGSAWKRVTDADRRLMR